MGLKFTLKNLGYVFDGKSAGLVVYCVDGCSWELTSKALVRLNTVSGNWGLEYKSAMAAALHEMMKGTRPGCCLCILVYVVSTIPCIHAFQRNRTPQRHFHNEIHMRLWRERFNLVQNAGNAAVSFK
ncbi:hypothetical protein HBI25_211130 [Parastagonospora nodorum]|nr:hypothetical protein HBH53_191660 [Parastagonospora nodorum]KAH3992654.1 hypothetical protein HBI10_215280 [Parastagonospora nodorum]KAH4010460.1 hypothetical protein HBI13_208240 [Parastagonospora nodorum]KAH4018788.1 hypothetical protein HBI09_189630 [Parastagonospora nodorum]KAH4061659.1 hypothetical protein HBH50_218810 [Parastagonospora nodorum]